MNMITFVNPRRMTKAFESLMDQIRGNKIAGCFLKNVNKVKTNLMNYKTVWKNYRI